MGCFTLLTMHTLVTFIPIKELLSMRYHLTCGAKVLHHSKIMEVRNSFITLYSLSLIEGLCNCKDKKRQTYFWILGIELTYLERHHLLT